AFDWQGTPYWKYMRPSTLFGASKFDGYLNANNLNQTRNTPASGGYGGTVDISSIPDDKLPF
ncbi:conserved phage C-terminal domain-containing protein, partial [Lactobacillus xujianguonis]|uniref:conserved phage C-terminal domain-containing protein n=2 Tax=Lactobacillaceae TaxID=33958 RepID=UPI000FF965E0